MQNIGSFYGITLDEAAEAMRNAMKLLPPPGEMDILLIKANPSLNWFQRWRLIRYVRRMMKNG